jgi:hypothetical protein
MQAAGKKSSRRREATVKAEASRESSPVEEEEDFRFPHLRVETPLELIDQVFMGLDRVSRALNECSRKAPEECLSGDLERAIAHAQGLSLEELHNLEYTSLLSYIWEVAQRKWPKSKQLGGLQRMVEGELRRCEALYFEHAEDYEYLEALSKRYCQ